MPDRVKLIAALKRFGLTVEQVEFDHSPPLALREVDPATGDTIPPQNDPNHIYMLTLDEHREKTFGRGGTKRATVADGDVHKIAKAKRLNEEQQTFRRRLLERDESEQPKRTSKWPKRPMGRKKPTKVKGRSHE
ncbi:hypothetical protein Oant_1560 [Brucella anthropi ATCC 49188]|uniref:Uncharacterized protein n=2 Tax=Brucella anthropi TaxID=529 RepID=A6WZ72_BRUA4|nr:hypothetical protein Oant_1560 [Brucella anthropi ATCC 49188]SUA65348.1 Uncharacterised protein [Brucella anthropi]